MELDAKAIIKKEIEQNVFTTSPPETIVSKGEDRTAQIWLFDFRRVLMFGHVMHHTTTLFNNDFPIDQSNPTKPSVQLCGLEAAAISIVSGIVANRYIAGEASANGFFVRKARKKDGLLKTIEGTILPDVPIVLVDDVISSGASFIRQVEVLEKIGQKVSAVWCILRFRDKEFYTYFKERNIPIYNVFTLDDFTSTLNVKNFIPKVVAPTIAPWRPIWIKKIITDYVGLSYVLPKSTPVCDDRYVYMGTDAGSMVALNQNDGSLVWEMRIGLHPLGKGIFSSPALHNKTIFFGGYDGNVYALDANTGKKKWVNFEADWVGSSPCISEKHGLVYIGLEFGLIKKRGGIAAIDMTTGRTAWAYRSMKAYTHSSPIYIKEHDEVVIGSNDGAVYLFDAHTGSLKWVEKTGDPTAEELVSGFSGVDIKDACVYDSTNDLILGGNMGGTFFAISRVTGKTIWTFEGEYGFWSRPIIHDGILYVSCIDRHIYCINPKDGTLLWKKNLGARAFCTPTIIDGHVIVGANTGKLSKLDMHTGEEVGYITLTERITNPPAYNPTTRRMFLSTHANEIYCLEAKEIDTK